MVSALRGKLTDREYKKLIRDAVAELLKQNPDLDVAEANLLAAEATGSAPSVEPVRAKKIFQTVKAKAHGAMAVADKNNMPKRTMTGKYVAKKSIKPHVKKKTHKVAVRKRK